jgi:N-methylhydantoinase A
VVPTEAGVGSAVGFLLAPVAYEVVRSRHQVLSGLQADVVNALMEEMREEALSVVSQGSSEQDLSADLVESRHAYMRYVGQGHEIPVQLPVESYDQNHVGMFRELFEQAYSRLYGRSIDEVEIEVLSWTLTMSTPMPEEEALPAFQPDDASSPESVLIQTMFDPGLAQWVDTPVYLREQLRPGDRMSGPALITEDQTTTVVTSHYDFLIDAQGYIVLTAKTGDGKEDER